jgi:hypothetical protein
MEATALRWRPQCNVPPRRCPALSELLARRAGMDRVAALRTAIDAVRRAERCRSLGVRRHHRPLPMLDLFDKGVRVRMGVVL